MDLDLNEGASKPRKSKPEPKAKFGSLREAGLESFDNQEIHRGELKNATYNPRIMGDEERGKLKKALKRHGLVAPVTWNKRTGRIVGGHQRISILDSLMQTSDYRLTVAVIDVDEAREKELNVLLNNQQAMGSWDMGALKEMFADSTVSLEGAGLDISDMIQMFGDSSLDERQEDLQELAGKLGDLSGSYSAIQKRNKQKATEEFFLVFVFPDGAHVNALLAALNMKDNRYQSGKYLMDRLGVEPPAEEDDESAAG